MLHRPKPKPVAGPVAYSVECWTLRYERMRPSEKGPGFEARQPLDAYGPPGRYGYNWWHAVPR